MALRPCVSVPTTSQEPYITFYTKNQMRSLCKQWWGRAQRHREVAFPGLTILTEGMTINSVIRLRTLFPNQPILRKFPVLKSFKIWSLAIFIRKVFVVHLKFVLQRDETNLFQLLCTTHIIYTTALSIERKKCFFIWMRKIQLYFKWGF